MGSYDGAESCELVGCFLLHEIGKKYGNIFGLYRDDGLGVTTAPPRQVELIKKGLCDIFKRYGLKITIEANKKIVNFLDVTLNLTTGKYAPYNKPNNTPLYVHKKSNHPPGIIKNIPVAVNKRLSEISSDEESFNRAAPLYQEALDKSGHNHQLKFSPPDQLDPEATNLRRKRHRNIIWYNPPFSKSVSTNVGKTFLQIIDEEFPKGHILHKIFNRNTIKIGYSCMSNVKQNIDAHNKKTLSQHTQKTTEPARSNSKDCNCRKPDECPLSGHCLKESVSTKPLWKTEDAISSYVGLTGNTFKSRYNNHKASFKNKDKKLSTELSKYVWELKDNGVDYTITWKVLKQAQTYSPSTNRCNLCLWEKYFIICKPQLATLNKRNELVSACRHAKKFLLCNYNPCHVHRDLGRPGSAPFVAPHICAVCAPALAHHAAARGRASTALL